MSQTDTTWDWLAGTYWYVPQDNLLAYLSRPSTQESYPVNDQTVFAIRESKGGYFWGNAVVQLGDRPRTCYFLTGSVSPLGNVVLTFTPVADVTRDTTVTHGYGVMTVRDGQAAMLNQMASGPATMQVSHWAYMLQTVEGDAAWNALPGVEVTVPEFLEACTSAAD